MNPRWPDHWRSLNHDPAAVAAARQDRQWSQARLAREVGISRGFMCEIEAGTRNANAAMLRRIARTLEIPVARLKRHEQAPT